MDEDEEPYRPVLSERERKELLRAWRAGVPDLGSAEGVAEERPRIEELRRAGALDARAAKAGLYGLDAIEAALGLRERERRRAVR